jgi:hypothetical protein
MRKGVIFLAALFVLGSCASAPKTGPESDFPANEFSGLAGGGSIYITVDVPASRPILDLASLQGLSGSRNAEILDRTYTAQAALYPPGGKRSFLVTALGKYPKGQADLSFSFSRGWKKSRAPGGQRYWRSEQQGLSVYLDARQARLSDGEPFAAAGEVAVPADFPPLRAQAVLAGWLEDAADPINGFMVTLGLPLQIPAERALFAIYPAGGGTYTVTLRLDTPSASQARALLSMVSMVRLFLGSLPGEDGPASFLALMLASPPEQDDKALVLRSGVVEGRDIALLFTLFSVY